MIWNATPIHDSLKYANIENEAPPFTPGNMTVKF